jgi:hypothetical protein
VRSESVLISFHFVYKIIGVANSYFNPEPEELAFICPGIPCVQPPFQSAGEKISPFFGTTTDPPSSANRFVRLTNALTSIVGRAARAMKIVVAQNTRFSFEVRAATEYISPY